METIIVILLAMIAVLVFQHRELINTLNDLATMLGELFDERNSQ